MWAANVAHAEGAFNVIIQRGSTMAEHRLRKALDNCSGILREEWPDMSRALGHDAAHLGPGESGRSSAVSHARQALEVLGRYREGMPFTWPQPVSATDDARAAASATRSDGAASAGATAGSRPRPEPVPDPSPGHASSASNADAPSGARDNGGTSAAGPGFASAPNPGFASTPGPGFASAGFTYAEPVNVPPSGFSPGYGGFVPGAGFTSGRPGEAPGSVFPPGYHGATYGSGFTSGSPGSMPFTGGSTDGMPRPGMGGFAGSTDGMPRPGTGGFAGGTSDGPEAGTARAPGPAREQGPASRPQPETRRRYIPEGVTPPGADWIFPTGSHPLTDGITVRAPGFPVPGRIEPGTHWLSLDAHTFGDLAKGDAATLARLGLAGSTAIVAEHDGTMWLTRANLSGGSLRGRTRTDRITAWLDRGFARIEDGARSWKFVITADGTVITPRSVRPPRDLPGFLGMRSSRGSSD